MTKTPAGERRRGAGDLYPDTALNYRRYGAGACGNRAIREAIHETTPICAPRNCDCFDHRVVGSRAGIRIGRLRPEPASQQHNGPLHLRRSESELVHKAYRSRRRSCAEWQHGLHPVIRRGGPAASAGWAKRRAHSPCELIPVTKARANGREPTGASQRVRANGSGPSGRPDDRLREPRRATARAHRQHPSRAASRPPQDDGPCSANQINA